MSFKVNSSQQISFNDSVFSLTAREKKALDNSWAKIFADEIFPNIDEESYTKTTRQCKVSFNCNHCVGCPYQGQYRPKIDGWNATFITSKNASNRAKSQRYMQSEEFSNYAKLRNGVETVPANIRKNYRLDKLPRGKQRGKFFFGSKIAALNFRKLFGFRKGLVNYAQNPIFG